MLRHPPRSTLFPTTPLSRPPEQVLEEERVAAAIDVEEVRRDKTIENQRGAGHHHRRHREDHHERRDDLRPDEDRKSTRLNSSHLVISYAVFCLKTKNRCRTT